MNRWWTDWRDYRALPFPGDMNAQPYFVYEAIRAHEEAARKIEGERMAAMVKAHE